MTHHFDVAVDDGLVTGATTSSADIVLRSGAAADAVGVARQALAAVVELASRTGRHAVRPVFDVLAARAVARSGADARLVTLVVTVFAQFRSQFVNPGKKIEFE